MENGYPISIWIETTDAEDKKEGWEGYESTVTDEHGEIIAEFTHNELRDRALWAEGFFKGFVYIPEQLK